MESYYFNNFRGQIKKGRARKVYFKLESDEGGREAIQETWKELKRRLLDEELEYDNLDDIKKTRFIEVLNELLSYVHNKERVTVELKYYAKSKRFLRAAIINSECELTKDRFMPRADKMKSGNRFSPKGIEWLYLGFDRYIADAKKCCLAEVRAKNESRVKFCEFKYAEGAHRVIDLTIADKKSWDDITNREISTPEETTVKFVLDVYCKLLSEELFIPVISTDKDKEYAPFQCMAQYFKSLGYDGIIYKSTVSKVGKNLVMFNKDSFLPVEIL